MFRILIAAAALAVPALPAVAQTSVHDTHAAADGAAAGRSPHKAYRPLDAARSDCGRAAMHSVPAGKGHVFGRHALAGAPCAADRVAVADTAKTQARD